MTMIDRSKCPARRHGTEQAYWGSRCRCRDAVAASIRYRQDLAAGVKRLIPAAGTRRRIQAMNRDGHRMADIGAELHVTGAAVTYVLQRDKVLASTAWLITAVADKKRGKPGHSVVTRGRAERNLWLPWEAWEHADIDDPLPVTEQEALVGWLNSTDTPTAPAGPLAILLGRLDTLLPAARTAMSRKAHALHKQGDTHPLVHQGETIYHRDQERLHRLAKDPLASQRWTAA